jgi:hypothetical protein
MRKNGYFNPLETLTQGIFDKLDHSSDIRNDFGMNCIPSDLLEFEMMNRELYAGKILRYRSG